MLASLVPLQSTILGLVAVAAPAVVFTRDTLRLVVVTSFYTWTLVVLFVVFSAPDVALSMMVVGAVAYPLVLLVAVARARGGKS
jgi:energy-converting hydrogenase B subunit D